MPYLQRAVCNKKTCVYEYRNLVLLQQFDRLGCCSNALDLHLGGAVFEPRVGHRLYLVFSWLSSVIVVKCGILLTPLLHSHFLP
jgi:hypothetical protein